MRVVLLAIMMIFSFCSYAQTFSKEEKFIAICKAIASIEDVRDSSFLCDYKDKNTLFILSKTEFVSDPNKKIDLDIDDIGLSIWFKKDLFFRNIPYWFEFSEISEKGKKKVVVKLRSFNSVNVRDKKPTVHGEVILQLQKGGYHVLQEKLTIKEPKG